MAREAAYETLVGFNYGNTERVSINWKDEDGFDVPLLSASWFGSFVAHCVDVIGVFERNLLWPNEALIASFGETLEGSVGMCWRSMLEEQTSLENKSFVSLIRVLIEAYYLEEECMEIRRLCKLVRCPEDTNVGQFSLVLCDWKRRLDVLNVPLSTISDNDCLVWVFESVDLCWRIRYNGFRKLSQDTVEEVVAFFEAQEDMKDRSLWRIDEWTM